MIGRGFSPLRRINGPACWRHRQTVFLKTKYHLSTSFPSFPTSSSSALPFQDQKISVLLLKSCGQQEILHLSIRELKTNYHIYYRDITSLGITMSSGHSSLPQLKLKYNRRNSTIISPRETSVILSIGNIKAILLSESVLIFDYQTPVVKSWLSQLDVTMAGQYDHFELFILENLLMNVCNNFDRRLILYHALLQNIEFEHQELISSHQPQGISQQDLSHHSTNNSRNPLGSGSSASSFASDYHPFQRPSPHSQPSILRSIFHNFHSMYSFSSTNTLHNDPNEDIIYKLSPLLDILTNFQLELQECRNALLELLKNDHEMIQILLSERLRAEQNNYTVDLTRHELVELLFENYVVQMNNILHDVMYLISKVNRQKDVSDLTMKIKRNRLLWLNANLGATSVCLGFGAYVFGAFGMNLTSGLESVSLALFYGVTTTTILFSLFAYKKLITLMYQISPFSSQYDKKNRNIIDHYYVKSLLLDSVFIDSLLNLTEKRLSEKGANSYITRSEFIEIYKEIKSSNDGGRGEGRGGGSGSSGGRGGGGIHQNQRNNGNQQHQSSIERTLSDHELREVNIIFDLIDVNSDGHWNTKEILTPGPTDSKDEMEFSR